MGRKNLMRTNGGPRHGIEFSGMAAHADTARRGRTSIVREPTGPVSGITGIGERGRVFIARAQARSFCALSAFGRRLRDSKGQGTTEYAILVGVLVVIAIIAVGLFRGKLQELWTSIADGINGL